MGADRRGRNPHRGQRWPGVPGEFAVAKSHDGNLARDVDAAKGTFTDCCERFQVAAADDSRGWIIQVQECTDRAPSFWQIRSIVALTGADERPDASHESCSYPLVRLRARSGTDAETAVPEIQEISCGERAAPL